MEGVYLKSFGIVNLKAIKDTTIFLNQDLNIITGVNNSGKTTLLEAIALWKECFDNLIKKAKKSGENYRQGDWVLGSSTPTYLAFEVVNSVRAPRFSDLFHNCDTKNKIVLKALLANHSNQELHVDFEIYASMNSYAVSLVNHKSYDYTFFNKFFSTFPNPVELTFVTPVARLEIQETYYTEAFSKHFIKLQKSFGVMRNRIYKLYRDRLKFSSFQEDLGYILFNNKSKIQFLIESNPENDIHVVVKYGIGDEKPIKDIALLGSGTLQLIEVLLSLHTSSNDLNLVILDEPDSYLHREIQNRLMTMFVRYASAAQCVLTTHNESLIRSSDPKHVFHFSLENEVLKPISENSLNQILPKRGLSVSATTPILRELGSNSGLDFINALEADKIIFVEGREDAILLSLAKDKIYNIGNERVKIMYWIMGGISTIIDKLEAYKEVFSGISNSKTLWEKCSVLIDKDLLSSTHINEIKQGMASKYGIPVYVGNYYTQESVLLTDPKKLAILLKKFIEAKKETNTDLSNIEQEIRISSAEVFTDFPAKLSKRYSDAEFKGEYIFQRCKKLLEKGAVKRLSLTPNSYTMLDNVELRQLELKSHFQAYALEVNASERFYELANKEDVEAVLNLVLNKYGLTIDINKDFELLVPYLDKSSWFEHWDFMKELVS